MKSIYDVILGIESLTIHEEEFDSFKKLLDLPKPLFLQVMIGIIDGKISSRDFNVILADLKNEIHSYEPVDVVFPLSQKILDKMAGNPITHVLLRKDNTTKQLYIKDRAIEKGIPLVGDDWKDIFIAEEDYHELTINYDNIKLSKEDIVFMSDNNLSQIQMKKLKLLQNYLLLKKPYVKEE